MERTWAGDTIRIARKAAGLTQEQLAYMLEIPKEQSKTGRGNTETAFVHC